MRRAILTALTCGSLVAPTANADNLMPLPDALRQGADEQYLLVRCAGLYYSVALYGGEAQLGSDVAKDLDARVEILMQMAALLRLEHQADVELAGRQIMLETSRIADLYIERYHRNYALRGLPFTPDTVWDADMELCGDVLGAER